MNGPAIKNLCTGVEKEADEEGDDGPDGTS